MKFLLTVAILFIAALPVYADGPKSCEELKSEIAKKLDANNAKGYTLDIVDKDKDADGKVVGSCGGGDEEDRLQQRLRRGEGSGGCSGEKALIYREFKRGPECFVRRTTRNDSELRQFCRDDRFRSLNDLFQCHGG